jgi:nitrate reductase delta subunit
MTTEYEQLARLFEYPGADYREALAGCRAAVEFARSMEGLSLDQMQEAFIQAFDLNPDAALDIGWHLYGENYERGEFLVKMRGELRRYGVAESRELPDHLTHVLRVLARMAEGERPVFANTYLLPALSKMTAALERAGDPFLKLLKAVEQTALAGVDHE